jgi:hypothetical protein
MARKLTVAVWYLMMGRWTPLEEIDQRLCVKVGKIIGQVGPQALTQLGKTRPTLREEAYQSLKTGRVSAPVSHAKPSSEPKAKANLPEAIIYVLDPHKKFTPKAKDNTLAAEYGLR